MYLLLKIVKILVLKDFDSFRKLFIRLLIFYKFLSKDFKNRLFKTFSQGGQFLKKKSVNFFTRTWICWIFFKVWIFIKILYFKEVDFLGQLSEGLGFVLNIFPFTIFIVFRAIFMVIHSTANSGKPVSTSFQNYIRGFLRMFF